MNFTDEQLAAIELNAGYCSHVPWANIAVQLIASLRESRAQVRALEAWKRGAELGADELRRAIRQAALLIADSVALHGGALQRERTMDVYRTLYSLTVSDELPDPEVVK